MTEFFALPLVKGILGGLITAVLVDLRAWNASSLPFNWKAAVTHWLIGALSGAGFGAAVI
ncbi:MAG TPA: hypothetical protein VM118_11605 [Acidobacteriota bacterium]|nr:hypothetical protein [Acidobacteriota bacterium]